MGLRKTVLVFVIDRQSNHVLLINKKRGMGAGKWNAPGGKLNEPESPEQAVLRECVEETGISPLELSEIGLLEFRFPSDSLKGSWDNVCRVFVSTKWEGALQPENSECSAFWWPIEAIDYSKFWPDDQFWLPELFKGTRFHRIYHFDREDHLIREERII